MACPSLGTLYFANSNSSEKISVEDWQPEHIGIPVMIFDTGKAKRSCGLTMVFAEKVGMMAHFEQTRIRIFTQTQRASESESIERCIINSCYFGESIYFAC